MKTIKELEGEIKERKSITEEEHNLILEYGELLEKKIKHPIELGEIQLERIVFFMRKAKLQTIKDVLKLIDEMGFMWVRSAINRNKLKQKIMGK